MSDVLSIEAYLDKLPLEYLIYGLTILVVGFAIYTLKVCNYSFKSILSEVLESESGIILSTDMDLGFLFPKVVRYLEDRLERENNKKTSLRLCLLLIKSKFIQSLLIKYVRTKIIPSLMEKKKE